MRRYFFYQSAHSSTIITKQRGLFFATVDSIGISLLVSEDESLKKVLYIEEVKKQIQSEEFFLTLVEGGRWRINQSQ